MLGIISIATLVVLIIIGIFMIFIVVGGNIDKSEEERRNEDREQIEYLKEYAQKHNKNK